MNATIAASVFFAGFFYAVTPGPGVLAVLGIGAARGRMAAARFLGGHCAGDVVWYTLASASIIGVSSIGERVFQILGFVSGAYLIYLGIQALRHGRGGKISALMDRDPLRHGIAFGLTNPKAYPVAAAMFTALLAGQASHLGWGDLPVLVGIATLGSLAGDAIYVYAVGVSAMRRFYERHEIAINRVSGAIFIGFGGKAIADSIGR
jgi:threonine efflux protein